jgi:hypothetical protein
LDRQRAAPMGAHPSGSVDLHHPGTCAALFEIIRARESVLPALGSMMKSLAARHS